MSLSTAIAAAIGGTLKGTNDLGTPTFALAKAADITLKTGTAAGLADLLFSDQRTLAASATENLDLAGGLTDPLGATLTFVKIKAILVRASSGNTNNVVVGGQTVNGFLGPFGAAAHTVAVPPGGALLLAAPSAGWAVTPGTGDLLKILNGGAGTGVTYDVVIVGTSA